MKHLVFALKNYICVSNLLMDVILMQKYHDIILFGSRTWNHDWENLFRVLQLEKLSYHNFFMGSFREATIQAFAQWNHLKHRNWLSLQRKFQQGSKQSWKKFIRAVNVYHQVLDDTKSKRDAIAAAYQKYPKITLVAKKSWNPTKGNPNSRRGPIEPPEIIFSYFRNMIFVWHLTFSFQLNNIIWKVYDVESQVQRANFQPQQSKCFLNKFAKLFDQFMSSHCG